MGATPVDVTGPSCPRCRSAVSLHLGRPRVTGDGRVELFCENCWGERDTALPDGRSDQHAVAFAAADDSDQSPGLRRAVAAATAAVVLIALGAVERPAGSTASPLIGNAIAATVTGATAPREQRRLGPTVEAPTEPGDHGAPAVADEPELEVAPPPIPMRDDEPLDEWYPTLAVWVHPVPGSAEIVPHRGSRQFGAARQGVRRPECMEGHCGVDLGGTRGQPVVAVAWGVVVRVEHSEQGRDGRSGRYVRIQHPDDVYTSYMHLDAIADGLSVGDEVEAGQMIGTLGATAVHSAEPHLHFSLEIPDPAGGEGAMLYADPMPFLARSEVRPLDGVPVVAVVPRPRGEREADGDRDSDGDARRATARASDRRAERASDRRAERDEDGAGHTDAVDPAGAIAREPEALATPSIAVGRN